MNNLTIDVHTNRFKCLDTLTYCLNRDDVEGLIGELDHYSGKYAALYMLLAMMRSKEHKHNIISAIKLMVPDISDQILYNDKKEEIPMNTKVFYFRDEDKFPVGCAAYTYELVDDDKNVAVSFGISTHNPEDGFKRSVGRVLAIGRMVDKPTKFMLANDTKTSLVRNIERVISESATNKGYPTRVRKAAKKHLSFLKMRDVIDGTAENLYTRREGFIKRGQPSAR